MGTTWMTVRIVLAMIGFAARFVFYPRKRRFVPTGTHDGIAYATLEKKTKVKGKEYTAHWLGMPLRSVPLRIHREEPLDRFRRRILFPAEDTWNKEKVFLICHHPATYQLFFDNDALRAAVLAVLERADELEYDGAILWARTYNTADSNHFVALAALVRACSMLEADASSIRWRHSYRWKTVVVEAAIWAMVAYGFGSAIERIGSGKENIHVELSAIFLLGLLVALGLFALVLAAVAFWLRGATRGFDAFLLHAFLLAVLLPVGPQLASDLNRGLDRSASSLRHGVAESCERKSSKGGPVYEVTMKKREPPIPDDPWVVEEICESIRGPTPITFTLGAGFLGLKWYRQIETPTAVWTP